MCDGFAYGVMLRDPLQLMTSKMNFQDQMSRWNPGKPQWKRVPDAAKLLHPLIASKEVPHKQVVWTHFDNYQTRVIANAFDVPAGGITEEHVAKAKSVLEKHNFVVGILEDLHGPDGEKLFSQLGWRVDSHSKRASRVTPTSREFTASEKAFLLELNKHDIALYEDLRSSHGRLS